MITTSRRSPSFSVIFSARLLASVVVFSALAGPDSASAEQPYPVSWLREVTPASRSDTVTLDGVGGVYISGYTTDSVNGPNAGGQDIFVARYDTAGSLIWTSQRGTTGDDRVFAASADGAGSVYVAGSTSGSLDGVNAGDRDLFVSKYDTAGNLLWSKQAGTSAAEGLMGITADHSGNVYATGFTDGNLAATNAGVSDAILNKYDAAGNLVWARQWGTSATDVGRGVSTDASGNVYVSGFTSNLTMTPPNSPREAFVNKFDSAGNLLWSRVFGSTPAADFAYADAVDALGNVYVVGETDGPYVGPISGNSDAFLTKYDSNGNLIWKRQFGVGFYDEAFGVSLDASGNIFVTGGMGGTSGADGFVTKFNALGSPLWTQQIANTGFDESRATATDASGNVYLSGYTNGLLDPTIGNIHAFVMQLSPVPEPGTFILGLIGSAGGFLIRRRCRRQNR